MHRPCRLTGFCLALVFAVLSGPALAQQITYCDTQTMPYGDFTLTIPAFDIAAYALVDVEVVLNVTYSGLFEGENFDTVEPCNYSFGMNLYLGSTHLDGAAIEESGHAELGGWLGEVGGADPSTVSTPFSGTLVDGLVITWDNLINFHLDQTLTFDLSSFGGVSELFGDADFSWSFELTAEICATYSYDTSVPVQYTSYGAVKALYR